MGVVTAKTDAKMQSLLKSVTKLKEKIVALRTSGVELSYCDEPLENAQELMDSVIDELNSALSDSWNFGIMP